LIRVIGADRKTGKPIYGFTQRGLFFFGLPLGGIIAAMVIALVAIHANHHDASVNCHSQTEQAAIGAAVFRKMRQSSAELLPRINLPGLTHRELEVRVALSQAEEAKRVKRLETLARRDCATL
jgi:hypothetical protein